MGNYGTRGDNGNERTNAVARNARRSLISVVPYSRSPQDSAAETLRRLGRAASILRAIGRPDVLGLLQSTALNSKTSGPIDMIAAEILADHDLMEIVTSPAGTMTLGLTSKGHQLYLNVRGLIDWHGVNQAAALMQGVARVDVLRLLSESIHRSRNTEGLDMIAAGILVALGLVKVDESASGHHCGLLTLNANGHNLYHSVDGLIR